MFQETLRCHEFDAGSSFDFWQGKEEPIRPLEEKEGTALQPPSALELARHMRDVKSRAEAHEDSSMLRAKRLARLKDKLLSLESHDFQHYLDLFETMVESRGQVVGRLEQQKKREEESRSQLSQELGDKVS